MYKLKKWKGIFTNTFVGTGPSSYEKNNLQGRGLTKVEKRCSIPFPEEPDTPGHNNTTGIMKHAGKEKAETKRCVVLLLTHKYNYAAFGYVHSPYFR